MQAPNSITGSMMCVLRCSNAVITGRRKPSRFKYSTDTIQALAVEDTHPHMHEGSVTRKPPMLETGRWTRRRCSSCERSSTCMQTKCTYRYAKLPILSMHAALTQFRTLESQQAALSLCSLVWIFQLALLQSQMKMWTFCKHFQDKIMIEKTFTEPDYASGLGNMQECTRPRLFSRQALLKSNAKRKTVASRMSP